MKTLITILLTICVVFCTEPKARKGYHAPYASVTDSFVQRHDTLFSVRNHLYTGNYYEVNGQKYAWGYSKDTMFYGWLENKFPIGTKFDIYNPEIFQHYIGIGVHKPVPVLDGIGAPTDTINTWGLYHKDIERLDKEGMNGHALINHRYYDSCVVLEFAVDPDTMTKLIADFKAGYSFVAALSFNVYKRYADYAAFDRMTGSQMSIGEMMEHSDQIKRFPNSKKYDTYVRLFWSGAYTPEAGMPFSVYALPERGTVVAIIPTVHPLLPPFGLVKSDAQWTLVSDYMYWNKQIIEPCSVKKELHYYTKETVPNFRDTIIKREETDTTYEQRDSRNHCGVGYIEIEKDRYAHIRALPLNELIRYMGDVYHD